MNGNCKSCSGDKLVADDNPKVCISPTDNDCLKMSQTGDCLSCKNSKILSVGSPRICVKPMTGCLDVKNSGTCQKCDSPKYSMASDV